MATSAASSEHFEKLHEIFRGLHEDLRGVPERLLGTAGTEEKKKLIRDFDEKQQEANETVRTGTSPYFLFLFVGLCQK